MGAFSSFFGFSEDEDDTKNRTAMHIGGGVFIYPHPSHSVSSNGSGGLCCRECGAEGWTPNSMDGKCVPRTMDGRENGRKAKHWTYRGDPIFADPSHVMAMGAGNWWCSACNISAADDGHALDNACEASPAEPAPAKTRWWQ